MADPVQSLDADLDADSNGDPNDAENAWARAIERRRAEIRDGVVQPVDGAEVLKRLREWRPSQRR